MSGKLLALLCSAVAAVFVWSAIRPHDYFTWFLEVLPVLLAVPPVVLTYRRFRLTPMLYVLIAIHATVLIIGGHYTYAEMPLFNWLRDTLHLSRNYYDRVGHFLQGFVPALLARELLLRTSPLRRGKWVNFICWCIPLALSACYEFVEWWVALGTGEAATAFLGTQGDVWDTQWDMCMAAIGAMVALLTLSGAQDRQLLLPADSVATMSAGTS